MTKYHNSQGNDVYSRIHPGAGHFYAGNDLLGGVFLATELGVIAYYIGMSAGDATPPHTTLWILAAIHIANIATVPLTVDNYNDALLKRISFGIGGKGLSLKLYF